jgi:hypothetical protein
MLCRCGVVAVINGAECRASSMHCNDEFEVPPGIFGTEIRHSQHEILFQVMMAHRL